jgi:hypothetical protein
VLVAGLALAALLWTVNRREESASAPDLVAQPAAEGVETRIGAAAASQVGSREQVPAPELLAREDRGTKIEVREAGGAALAGASIFTKDVGGWVERGHTDDAGVLELDLEPDRTVEIVARAQGFVPGRDHSEPPHAAERTLVLEPGDRICGVALTSTGAPPRKPVRVLAYSRERELDGVARYVGRLSENDPSLLVATTDESGAFCLDGARRGELHVLACGGHGYADRRGITTVQAGTSNVSISLTRLFGVAIRFIDATGVEEVRSFGWRELGGGCGAPDARVHATTGVDVWLAGLDPKWTSVPPEMLLWIYSSDTESDTLGPMRLDHELAGFSPGSESFDAGTVAAEIPTHVVALDPTHSGRGTVDIVFTSRTGDDDGARARRFPEGQLRLTDESRNVWSFTVKPGDSDRVQVQGVPFGRYRARYVSQPFQFPPRAEPAIELLVDGAGAKLEVPLDGTGWVTFRLRRLDGTAYSGHIQLTLLEGEQGQSGSNKTRARVSVARSFDAPYRVEGLAPGTYTALAVMPTFESDAGKRFIVLDVRDGEETVVNAVVADD